MDRKTFALLVTEFVLIVVLVVVVAMDFNSKPEADDAAVAQVAEEAAEAVEEEGEAEETVAKAEEAAEEAEEAAEAEEVAEVEEKAEKKVAAAKKEAEPAKKAAAPAAGGDGAVADIIPMDNPAYAKHTKGIVMFTHKKHYTEYKAACGDCHHDENAEPLDLKEGDPVQGCIECHPKPSKAPRPKKGEPPLSDSEKMEYHTEALHANCINCHKDFNKKNNTKAAPTSCTTCHPKEKK